MLICGMRIVDKEALRGINKTMQSIIASRQNNDIRRWENWNSSTNIAIVNASIGKIIIDSE